jgi:acetyltransferase-like isoleucine patch superfamily enzyme
VTLASAVRPLFAGRDTIDHPVWHLLVNRVAGSFLVGELNRTRIYRACGLDIRSTAIHPGQWFFSSQIHIGEGAWIGQGAYFDTRAPIHIGPRANISPGVRLVTADHAPGGPERRAGTYAPRPIRVEEGAWVGAGAIVLSGVTIGAGAVVAAGAVVHRDCAPHTLYGGVPAKALRTLDGGERAPSQQHAAGGDGTGGQ